VTSKPLSRRRYWSQKPDDARTSTGTGWPTNGNGTSGLGASSLRLSYIAICVPRMTTATALRPAALRPATMNHSAVSGSDGPQISCQRPAVGRSGMASDSNMRRFLASIGCPSAR
jgi:hypothetical protein